jgi:hypothetical protein
MKNIFILSVVLSIFSASVFSQKNPSETVKKEFTKKYPSAQSVKWDSEEANEWEAEFNSDGKKMSACFDNTGKWLESETLISEKELPVAVVNTLNKDYEGFKKGPVEIFESPAMKGFEMSLKKGEKSLEVIFDKNGTILKKTDLKEEDEEDDKK